MERMGEGMQGNEVEEEEEEEADGVRANRPGNMEVKGGQKEGKGRWW